MKGTGGAPGWLQSGAAVLGQGDYAPAPASWLQSSGNSTAAAASSPQIDPQMLAQLFMPQGQPTQGGPQPQQPDQQPDQPPIPGWIGSLFGNAGKFQSAAGLNIPTGAGGSDFNLGMLGGPLQFANSAAMGSVPGMIGGGLSTLGSINKFLPPDWLGSPGGFSGSGIAGGALGGLGSGLGIYSGIQGLLHGSNSLGSLMNLGTGAAGLYSSLLAPGANALLGTSLPTLSSAVSSLFGGGATTAASFAPAVAEGAAGAGPGLAAAAGVGLAEVAGGAAPILAAVMQYFASAEEKRARESGALNNGPAGAFNSYFTSSLTGTTNMLDTIKKVGGYDKYSTQDLAGALPGLMQGLLPYYQEIEGPAGAPISALSSNIGMFGRKGTGDVGYWQGKQQGAEHDVLGLIENLMGRGMSYEDIGKIPGGLKNQGWMRNNLHLAPIESIRANYLQGRPDLGRTFQGIFNQTQSQNPLSPNDMPANMGSAQFGGDIWGVAARLGSNPNLNKLIQQHYNPYGNTEATLADIRGALSERLTTSMNAGPDGGGGF